MLTRIRKRFTYANVTMTLALVFAMSGGAYAASKIMITSTKQISPKVLKSLQGKNGAQGPAGAAGPQGPAGSVGPAGAAGSKGETGPEGKEGKEGKAGQPGEPGKAGKNGSPWTVGGKLPSESTETGGWSVGLGNTSIQGVGLPYAERTAISFTIPLAKALGEKNVQSNPVGYPTGASPEETERCPGNVEEPKAKAGYLCVYTGLSEEMVTLSPYIAPLTGSLASLGTSTAGAILLEGPKPYIEVIEENGVSVEKNTGRTEHAMASGSWAVTAE